jgi:cell division protein FtsB
VSSASVRPEKAGPRRPRFTGRAAVLVLVLAVLTVSYASSLRAYLQQRAHIGDLKVAIAEREASINSLEREKRRWQDPAFVKAQARARFGYLMPGETGFLVLDENGKPLESQTSLSDPDAVIKTVPTPWWSDAWASVELAGNPPAPSEGPASEIDGVAKGR